MRGSSEARGSCSTSCTLRRICRRPAASRLDKGTPSTVTSPTVGLQQPHHQARQRALARSGLADDREASSARRPGTTPLPLHAPQATGPAMKRRRPPDEMAGSRSSTTMTSSEDAASHRRDKGRVHAQRLLGEHARHRSPGNDADRRLGRGAFRAAARPLAARAEGASRRQEADHRRLARDRRQRRPRPSAPPGTDARSACV